MTRDGSLLELVSPVTGTATMDVCFDAFSAVEALRTRQYDLAILDDEALGEGQSGWMVDEVHRLSPHTPVVYVATNHSHGIERTARIHGVVTYLAKPVEPRRLMPVVRRALERNGPLVRGRLSSAPRPTSGAL